jgi:hypothetical protein
LLPDITAPGFRAVCKLFGGPHQRGFNGIGVEQIPSTRLLSAKLPDQCAA